MFIAGDQAAESLILSVIYIYRRTALYVVVYDCLHINSYANFTLFRIKKSYL